MSETTMTDAVARRLPDFIRTLRINREKRRESVYASDNVYALLDALDAAEARVRELEAMVSALNGDVHELGGRLSTIEAETIERCAKVMDDHYFCRDIDWWLRATRKDAAREACETGATAIRKLAQEVR